MLYSLIDLAQSYHHPDLIIRSRNRFRRSLPSAATVLKMQAFARKMDVVKMTDELELLS